MESATSHPVDEIIGPTSSFLESAIDGLRSLGIDNLESYEIDHICYRCESILEYKDVCRKLNNFGIPLTEGMIANRPICIYLLDEAITFKTWKISCIEIPCPKEGSYYSAGLEHLEMVIGTESDVPPKSTKLLLESFAQMYPTVAFDRKAIDKEINADISLSLSNGSSVKFHARPIYEICAYETDNGLVEVVPDGYFD